MGLHRQLQITKGVGLCGHLQKDESLGLWMDSKSERSVAGFRKAKGGGAECITAKN